MKISLWLFVLLTLLSVSAIQAGSATWNLNPTSGDWNTASNWTPATVPNGPTDVATFDVSNTTGLSFSANPVEVSSIVFNPGASSFNIALNSAVIANLTLSGAGMINNSEVTQNLTLAWTHGYGGTIQFSNVATAGDDVAYTVGAGAVIFYDTTSAGSATFAVGGSLAGHETYGGSVGFYNNSTAGNASFTVAGALAAGGFGGFVDFNDTSTAGDSSFVVESSLKSGGGSQLEFYSSSTAGNATISVQGTTSSSGDPAYLDFWNTSSAGNAVITSEAGATAGAYYGFISFWNSSTGGNATLIANGGSAQGAPGGDIATQGDSATAGDATLIANGGTNGGTGGGIGFYNFGKATLIANGGTNGGGGGSIYFAQASMAAGEVHGNGMLAVRFDAYGTASLGSLAGDGTVLLGNNQVTVGTTSVSTEFSGVIQDAGSLAKSGTATLTLSGANTYSGGTTVLGGTLKVNNPTGSGTGTGAVSVEGGALAGAGIISGAVTIGTGSGAGASLAPGKGSSKPTTLTLQSALTFKADGSYAYKLNTKKAKGDQVVANGVTIESGAQFDLTPVQNKKLTTGRIFTAISNTATTAISGTFVNLADASTVTAGVNKLQVSYSGGDGNDLTLTVVP